MVNLREGVHTSNVRPLPHTRPLGLILLVYGYYPLSHEALFSFQ